MIETWWKKKNNSYITWLFQVWFQNRRTKWRKKHAAEMATAKRRQEEVEGVVAEGEDGCSDGEMDGGGETAAKRLRRELEQQYGPWEKRCWIARVKTGVARVYRGAVWNKRREGFTASRCGFSLAGSRERKRERGREKVVARVSRGLSVLGVALYSKPGIA